MTLIAPLEWRGPMRGVFQGGGGSVDWWTPGPKPLCHRHPTGPHPSGLLWTPWTPAKGDSTKRSRPAAGMRQDVAGDEARAVGAQEADGGAQFAALAEAAERDLRRHLGH